MARKEKSDKSTAPKKPGRFAQVREVFTASRKMDPMIGWWMALASLGTLVVMVGIGLLVKQWIYFLVLGVPLAALAASIVLSTRAKRAAYKSIEGQPGATGAALSSLRKGWYFEQQPVAVEAARAGDMSSAAMVFRATGRPGVVLVAEGPVARATKLAEAERKKISRIAGASVPVTVLRIGDGGGKDEVSIRKVTNKIQRMKAVLTKDEVAAVNKRLKAMGGMRPPLPAGVDPNRARMDRKAMRGR
ncbi:MAG: hypothetical protein QOE58_2250 [Actinomycetota bacterium]|jgi:hypothetical protein|nr:hypothetical protein [Actinomycetota bacterium]